MFSAPAVIWIILTLIGLMISASLDGTIVKVDFTAKLISVITATLLLAWGGFFQVH